MPTYDYLCRNCEDRSEYLGVPSESHPSCIICGSRNMMRLPSRINIGGVEMKTVTAANLTEPKARIVSIKPAFRADQSGRILPGLLIQAEISRGGPSEN